MEKRIIFHVDMDYFFAQVEERENPRFRGRPVVVGADPKSGEGRGVVSTCNYEARKFGIHSAMPISKAWRACPGAVFLPVNGRLYNETSQKIMEILRAEADKFEQVSVDEAYLDVTEKTEGGWDKAKNFAQDLKKKIFERESLTCSVGVGPNKLISKIAANLNKPDGLTVVNNEMSEKFLQNMAVGALSGIGPKTRLKLNRLGIWQVSDLKKLSLEKLTEILGKFGEGVYLMARGQDTRAVEESDVVKSFSREHTFEKDAGDPNIVLPVFSELLARVWKDREGFGFRTVTLIIRFPTFKTVSRSKTLGAAVAEFRQFKGAALKLLVPYLGKHKIRLIGVRVSNLVS